MSSRCQLGLFIPTCQTKMPTPTHISFVRVYPSIRDQDRLHAENKAVSDTCCPRMLSLINHQNKKKTNIRGLPKNQDLPGVLLHFSICHAKRQVVLWSIHTFWYKGSAKIKGKNQVRKKGLFLLRIAAKTRRLIFRKSFYLVF